MISKPIIPVRSRSLLISPNATTTTTTPAPYQTYSDSEHLLYKLRRVFFRHALPIYNETIIEILRNAWTSQTDASQFESQNGLRVVVNLYGWSRFSTKRDQPVDGYEYTVSINGQDPEFLGIVEPTFDAYQTATKLATKEPAISAIEFCPSSVFSIDRIFLNVQNDDPTNSGLSIQRGLEALLNNILRVAWFEINTNSTISRGRGLDNKRLVSWVNVTSGFVDASRRIDNVQRISLSWLVDGVDPSPLYFIRPKIEDLLPHFRNASLNVYEDVPMIAQAFEIIAYNSSAQAEQLRTAILNAWQSANPKLAKNSFTIIFDDKVAELSAKTTMRVKRDTAITLKNEPIATEYVS